MKTYLEILPIWKKLTPQAKSKILQRAKERRTGSISDRGNVFVVDAFRQERMKRPNKFFENCYIAWPRSKRFGEKRRLELRAAAKPKWFNSEANKLVKKTNQAAKSANTIQKIEKWIKLKKEAKQFLSLKVNNFKFIEPEKAFTPYFGGDFYDVLGELNPFDRKRKWELKNGYETQITVDQDFQGEYRGNGRWRTICNARHEGTVKCFIVLKSVKEVEAIFFTYYKNWKAPEGFHWAKDNNGIKLVKSDSIRDDYHPSARDILDSTVEILIEKLEQNRQRRLELETREAAFLAESKGVFVCVKDSLRAGNCIQGTMQFVNQFNLNPKKHYSATEVFEIASKSRDFGRARLAISAAIIQSKKDNERGFALLEEHCV
jgi:hypothetical protein